MTETCYFCGREVTSGEWILHPIGKITVEAYCCKVCSRSIRISGKKPEASS